MKFTVTALFSPSEALLNPRLRKVMRTFLLVGGLAFSSAASAEGLGTQSVDSAMTESAVVGQIQPRIVGGQPASQGEYPFMAALLYSAVSNPSQAQFCGASLIGSQWIMTAAHCVEGLRPDQLEVFIGDINLLSEQASRVAVQAIHVHSGYASQGAPDAALLQLQQPLGFTPLPLLPAGSGLEAAGTPVTVIGWGQLSETGGSSNLLQEVDLSVISDSLCRSVYGNNVNFTYEICAGYLEGGKDSCFGDSGGPLMVRQGGVLKQLGVVAGGAGCARPEIPGVYTRLPKIESWVNGLVNGSPVAESAPAFDTACNGMVCEFTAPSVDAAGNPLSNPVWRVDSARAGEGETLNWEFAGNGNYRVDLTLQNNQGGAVNVSSYINIGVDNNADGNVFSAGSSPAELALRNAGADAVVILGVPTYNEADPGGWRMQLQDGAELQVRFQEWDYLSEARGDASHAAESAAWMQARAGRYRMSDGSIWQFGRFDLSGNGQWQTVDFPVLFADGEQPRVFAGVQTQNDARMVSVRLRNLSNSGFEAALFEEERLTDGHAQESIGYVAIVAPADQGVVNVHGNVYHYSLQRAGIGSDWQDVLGHSVRLQEEQSRDDEVQHAVEQVDLLSIAGFLFGQPVSFAEQDPILLRRR